MILTGKCKEHFLMEFVSYEYEIDEVYLNALILKFFDSVEIYVSIIRVDFEDEFDIIHGWKGIVRYREKTIKVMALPYKDKVAEYCIILANDIYNKKNE